MAPLFVLYLLYVQGSSLVAVALLLMGFQVSHASLCEHFLRILGTQFGHSPGLRALLDDTTRPVLFLCNHRSWGDFWVDAALLGGTSFVSRWAVLVAIPMSGAWGWLHGWLWFFARGKKRSEGTTKWMSSFFKKSHEGFPGKGCVIYPEGTRTLLPQGLPLKPGGLAVAHSLGWPVQVVITTNKEKVIAERSMYLGLGTRVNTSVSTPLWPQDYAAVDDFIAAVGATWRTTWDEAYNGVSVPRPLATLPGAKKRRVVTSLMGRRVLNRARLLVVLVVLAYFWWRAHRRAQHAAAGLDPHQGPM